jgi:glyoxylase-like metal-dependent hydrolase (beta-lactamase superfamily II)
MTAQSTDYTGHVDPNGAPSTRDLPNITITKLSVGPMDNNAYLLVCKYTGEALLIDAANDADRILALLDGGPGKTTNPQDFTSLMDDLEERVFGVLHDTTWVYPGHGDDTTLGAERPHLAEWRARGW